MSAVAGWVEAEGDTNGGEEELGVPLAYCVSLTLCVVRPWTKHTV